MCSCAVNVAFFNQEPCFYWSHAHSLLMHEISTVMHFDYVFTQRLWKVMFAYNDKRFSAGNFVLNLFLQDSEERPFTFVWNCGRMLISMKACFSPQSYPQLL